ncbi:MAG: ankyrin repeat domain-containing protein, partial [Alphaproteobacteria bacterium]|nr:ankyrin repeat domain-containing protein [Alphaproteobacteria bacterium]
WLLANGGQVDGTNSKNSTPLMAAAEQGKLEALKILLLAGADPARKNNDGMTARAYAVNRERKSVVAWLDRNPEEIIFSRKVADRTLQEIFNFVHKERVTFIRKGADGTVEAVTRHSFGEIADKSALRRAFSEYKKYGGKRSEEEVFFNGISKPFLPKPKGAA